MTVTQTLLLRVVVIFGTQKCSQQRLGFRHGVELDGFFEEPNGFLFVLAAKTFAGNQETFVSLLFVGLTHGESAIYTCTQGRRGRATEAKGKERKEEESCKLGWGKWAFKRNETGGFKIQNLWTWTCGGSFSTNECDRGCWCSSKRGMRTVPSTAHILGSNCEGVKVGRCDKENENGIEVRCQQTPHQHLRFFLSSKLITSSPTAVTDGQSIPVGNGSCNIKINTLYLDRICLTRHTAKLIVCSSDRIVLMWIYRRVPLSLMAFFFTSEDFNGSFSPLSALPL